MKGWSGRVFWAGMERCGWSGWVFRMVGNECRAVTGRQTT